MSKLEVCDKVSIFVAGGANRYCAKPKGHDGECIVQEDCPTCHGTGRTGRTVSAPVAGARTVAQAMKTSGYAQKLEA